METFSFDPADFLDDPKVVVEYLNIALAENDPSILLSAINDVVRSRGMISVYPKIQFEQHNPYKSLTSDTKFHYNVVSKIVQGFDFKSTVYA